MNPVTERAIRETLEFSDDFIIKGIPAIKNQFGGEGEQKKVRSRKTLKPSFPRSPRMPPQKNQASNWKKRRIEMEKLSTFLSMHMKKAGVY